MRRRAGSGFTRRVGVRHRRSHRSRRSAVLIVAEVVRAIRRGKVWSPRWRRRPIGRAVVRRGGRPGLRHEGAIGPDSAARRRGRRGPLVLQRRLPDQFLETPTRRWRRVGGRRPCGRGVPPARSAQAAARASGGATAARGQPRRPPAHRALDQIVVALGGAADAGDQPVDLTDLRRGPRPRLGDGCSTSILAASNRFPLRRRGCRAPAR